MPIFNPDEKCTCCDSRFTARYPKKTCQKCKKNTDCSFCIAENQGLCSVCFDANQAEIREIKEREHLQTMLRESIAYTNHCRREAILAETR